MQIKYFNLITNRKGFTLLELMAVLVRDTAGIQVQILAVEHCALNLKQLFLPEMSRKDIVWVPGISKVFDHRFHFDLPH